VLAVEALAHALETMLEPVADGRPRQALATGDLLARQLRKVAQEQRRANRLVELEHGPGDVPLQLGPLDQLLGRRERLRPRRGLLAPRAPSILAVGLASEVARDAPQPRARVEPATSRPLERGHPGRLHDVVDLRRVDHERPHDSLDPRGMREQALGVTLGSALGHGRTAEQVAKDPRGVAAFRQKLSPDAA
jgi:hypothetical protein